MPEEEEIGLLPIEQASSQYKITELSFNKKGTYLACVISRGFATSHIWLLDVGTLKFQQFTFGGRKESSPKWTPDGKSFAFLSDRNGSKNIFHISVSGAEASPLVAGEFNIRTFNWSPDGSQIAFLRSSSHPKPNPDEPKVADDQHDDLELWVFNTKDESQRQIIENELDIKELQWMSETQLLLRASRLPSSESWNDSVFRVDSVSGSIEELVQPNRPFIGPFLSPDNERLAVIAPSKGGPVPHNLFVKSTELDDIKSLTDSLDRQVNKVVWSGNSDAYISATNDFRNELVSVSLDQSFRTIPLPYSVADFDVSSKGDIAFVGSTFLEPPELFINTSNAIHKVSRVLDWSSIQLADAEVFQFNSFDETTIEAAKMTPTSKIPEGGYPLVLYVHGGPASNFSATFLPWAQMLCASGYQVLMVNPRGSTGYGEDFVKANRGDWGGADFKDLMCALDNVLERGETNPNRLGIAGWSYGGYMAAWAITQTDRFKAAVSGAGMFDLAAEFGTEDDPAYDEWFWGTPWENPVKFMEHSPYCYIKHAKTPTLILHGEQDTTDPIDQSKALYRALKYYSVPCSLVSYPTEDHSSWKDNNLKDVLSRVINWFDRYLKKEQ